MSTRLFRLSEAQASELHAAFLHCRDAQTKTRFQAVRLYGLGHPVPAILDACGGCRSRLMEWARAYRAGGPAALLDGRKGGNRAKLTAQQVEAVQTQLHSYTPAQLLGPDAYCGAGAHWTPADLAALLWRDYVVTYDSPTSLRSLLKRCGLSRQRPAKQYKSHSDFKAMEFAEALEANS